MRTKRLVGPTVISLILSGMLADYLFMSGSRWSPLRFLVEVFSVLEAIFTPVFDPALYAWMGSIIVPIFLGAFVIVLLWLSITSAKTAMREATPTIAAADAVTLAQATTAPNPAVVPTPGVAPGSSQAWHYKLTTRLVLSFGMVGMLFGIAVCVIVYIFLSRGLRKEGENHVNVMATGIREIVAPNLGAGRAEEAAAAIEEYAINNSVAYLYVEQPDGSMIAYWPFDLPRYLRRDFPASAKRALRGAESQYRGFEVYEVAKRLGDGDSGFIHLAIWRQAMITEAQRIVAVIAATYFIVLCCVIAAFVSLARSLNRPVAELVAYAKRISEGCFAAPLSVQVGDELGDIALALERLRSSLHAATVRLGEEPLTRRPEQIGEATNRETC